LQLLLFCRGGQGAAQDRSRRRGEPGGCGGLGPRAFAGRGKGKGGRTVPVGRNQPVLPGGVPKNRRGGGTWGADAPPPQAGGDSPSAGGGGGGDAERRGTGPRVGSGQAFRAEALLFRRQGRAGVRIFPHPLREDGGEDGAVAEGAVEVGRP